MVKRLTLLAIALSTMWLLWSGHVTEPFLLILGLISVAIVVWVAVRMGIVDEEGAPIGLDLRIIAFAGWLLREIMQANLEVSRLILDPKLPIRPRMVNIRALQRTEIGRVILANSITLTPGTVSVDVEGDKVYVHALSLADAEEDLSGEMNRRILALERPSP